MQKTTQKRNSKNTGLIDRLSMWEWDCLVAAWRYYEHGATITSASFPWEIVTHYWGKGNNYSDSVRKTIANQFAITDHGRKGEKDWTESRGWDFECDTIPWATFYRFCEAEIKGYHSLVCKGDNGCTMVLPYCFHVDFKDRWIDRDHYILRGENSFINPKMIVK